MFNSIIMTTSLFGSVELINKSHIEGKRIPRELNIINGLTFVVSDYIFISGVVSYNYRLKS